MSDASSRRVTRATRADVARRAGVSPTAVTAVLTGRYPNVSVRPATRQRILDAARDLDYKPSALARGLKQQRSMLLAFLCRAVYHRSHEIMLGMQAALEPTEYSIVHYSRGDELEDEARHLRLCWDRDVDGIALTPMLTADGGTNLREVLQLVQRGVPLVQLPNDTLPEVPSVTIDLAAAGRLAADHLLELGHRRLACLVSANYDSRQDPGERAHPRQYVRGFQQRAQQAGAEAHCITYPSGLTIWAHLDQLMAMRQTLAERVLSHPARPTAVLAQHDYVALVLLRGLQEMGVSVPRDLSILGAHNVRSAALSVPALSSIEMHHDQLGERATAMLLEQIEGGSPQSQQVEPVVVPRESTAPPKM